LIEVNLLPGGKKKSAARPKFSLSLPKITGGLPSVDRWSLVAGLVVVGSLLSIGWLYMSVGGEVEELEVQTEVAVRDSIRLADVLAESSLLQSRADSIAERVAVIQEIDRGRYVWPHLLDEVGRALPDYAWLTGLRQAGVSEPIVFQIEGQAGTYFALTTFMENLEASPFIRGVQLIASEQTELSGGERLLYQFVLEAVSEEPPPELVETVPLFGPSVQLPPAGAD
jgi:Tfp pilus assembly protein PilN